MYSRIRFQHFDKETDVGTVNENGEHVRKRKRPGRKPNPPTLEERRTQNREAQRAFRERRHEAQGFIDRIAVLEKRLAKAELEADYLRGYVLQLSLSSITQHGSIPPVLVNTSTIQKGEALPLNLKTLLDNGNGHILDLSSATQAVHVKRRLLASSPAPLSCLSTRYPSRESGTDEFLIEMHRGTQLHPPSFSSFDPPPTPAQPEPSASTRRTLNNPTDIASFTHWRHVFDVTPEIVSFMSVADLQDIHPLQALHILRLQLKIGNVLGPQTNQFLSPSMFIHIDAVADTLTGCVSLSSAQDPT